MNFIKHQTYKLTCIKIFNDLKMKQILKILIQKINFMMELNALHYFYEGNPKNFL